MNQPAAVRTAIVLLWGALLLGVAGTFALLLLDLELPESPDGQRFFMILGVVSVFLIALNAALISFTARRHNWARLGLLVLIASSYIPYLKWGTTFAEEPWWVWFTSALEVLALILLFSRPAARWYRSQAS